jgi:hypothetical protein
MQRRENICKTQEEGKVIQYSDPHPIHHDKIADRLPCQEKPTTKRLEVLLKAEVPRHLLDLWRRPILIHLCLLRARHNTRFLIITHALLKEICLARERDVLHEVKGVSSVVRFWHPECDQQPISYKLNVLAHERRIHAQQGAWECISQELLFDSDSFGDDSCNGSSIRLVVEQAEEQAREVAVHALVAADEFVGESQAGHETALLEPEDGREGSAEEDAFDGRKGDETRRECGGCVGDPA